MEVELSQKEINEAKGKAWYMANPGKALEYALKDDANPEISKAIFDASYEKAKILVDSGAKITTGH